MFVNVGLKCICRVGEEKLSGLWCALMGGICLWEVFVSVGLIVFYSLVLYKWINFFCFFGKFKGKFFLF